MDKEDLLRHPHLQCPWSGGHRAETRTFVIPQPFPLWFHIPGVTSHPITGHTLVWTQTPRFLFSNPSHGESQPENTKLHAISGSARDNDFASGNDNSKDSKLIRPVGHHASFHWALETLDKKKLYTISPSYPLFRLRNFLRRAPIARLFVNCSKTSSGNDGNYSHAVIVSWKVWYFAFHFFVFFLLQFLVKSSSKLDRPAYSKQWDYFLWKLFVCNIFFQGNAEPLVH